MQVGNKLLDFLRLFSGSLDRVTIKLQKWHPDNNPQVNYS